MSVVCFDVLYLFFVFSQKTAYELRISDWSSDVCSSDLFAHPPRQTRGRTVHAAEQTFPFMVNNICLVMRYVLCPAVEFPQKPSWISSSTTSRFLSKSPSARTSATRPKRCTSPPRLCRGASANLSRASA